MNERAISNYASYGEGMRKSLLDKIFFMDKIDARVFVDYGCADGSLIGFLRTLFPEMRYVGYDISSEMVDQAKKKVGEEEGRVTFTADWPEALSHAVSGKNALILSSVIHEIYSYGTAADTQDFLSRMASGQWDFIVLRDMVPSMSIDKPSYINDVRRVMLKADQAALREFERQWGSIESNRNLVHVLLKYRYTDNLDREVGENYFPVTREELFSSIPDNYDIIFHEHFRLPFAVRRIAQDFGITLRDNTHLKLILEKRT
jgi:SAM-dependent methyltransferase